MLPFKSFKTFKDLFVGRDKTHSFLFFPEYNSSIILSINVKPGHNKTTPYKTAWLQ